VGAVMRTIKDRFQILRSELQFVDGGVIALQSYGGHREFSKIYQLSHGSAVFLPA